MEDCSLYIEKHPSRNTLQAELDANIHYNKDDISKMKNQVTRYFKEGFNDSKDCIMVETGFSFRRFKDPNLIRMSDGTSFTSTNAILIPWNSVIHKDDDQGPNRITIGLNAGRNPDPNDPNEPDVVAIGDNALRNNISSQNLAIGSAALINNTLGDGNVAIGGQAMRENVSGSNNMAVGRGTLVNVQSNNNTAIGNEALSNLRLGTFNTAIGNQAMANNISGAFNMAFGNEAAIPCSIILFNPAALTEPITKPLLKRKEFSISNCDISPRTFPAVGFAKVFSSMVFEPTAFTKPIAERIPPPFLIDILTWLSY
jgi:hypothetical protein